MNQKNITKQSDLTIAPRSSELNQGQDINVCIMIKIMGLDGEIIILQENWRYESHTDYIKPSNHFFCLQSEGCLDLIYIVSSTFKS